MVQTLQAFLQVEQLCVRSWLCDCNDDVLIMYKTKYVHNAYYICQGGNADFEY